MPSNSDEWFNRHVCVYALRILKKIRAGDVNRAAYVSSTPSALDYCWPAASKRAAANWPTKRESLRASLPTGWRKYA